MSHLWIKLANFTFEIDTLYPDTEVMCREYAIDPSIGSSAGSSPTPDCRIVITPGDIAREREISIREALYTGEYGEGVAPVFPDGYLETTAVYRKIADFLSYQKACVFHGAFIEKDGEGYLFTAKSGTGKTTHINNWLKEFPTTRVINGDKPILRFMDDRIYGYGTPWSGKEGMHTNACVPLKAIILLERGSDNHIEKITPGEAMSRLLGQCYRPHDSLGMKRALEMCGTLAGHTQLYRLACTMDQASALVAFDGMHQKE